MKITGYLREMCFLELSINKVQTRFLPLNQLKSDFKIYEIMSKLQYICRQHNVDNTMVCSCIYSIIRCVERFWKCYRSTLSIYLLLVLYNIWAHQTVWPGVGRGRIWRAAEPRLSQETVTSSSSLVIKNLFAFSTIKPSRALSLQCYN